jgi:hypothetical protein
MTLQKFDHVLLRKWRGESESGGRRAEVAEMKGGGAIYLNYIHFSLKKLPFQIEYICTLYQFSLQFLKNILPYKMGENHGFILIPPVVNLSCTRHFNVSSDVLSVKSGTPSDP